MPKVLNATKQLSGVAARPAIMNSRQVARDAPTQNPSFVGAGFSRDRLLARKAVAKMVASASAAEGNRADHSERPKTW